MRMTLRGNETALTAVDVGGRGGMHNEESNESICQGKVKRKVEGAKVISNLMNQSKRGKMRQRNQE